MERPSSPVTATVLADSSERPNPFNPADPFTILSTRSLSARMAAIKRNFQRSNTVRGPSKGTADTELELMPALPLRIPTPG